MTRHALERLKDRFWFSDPANALGDIFEKINLGAYHEAPRSVDGARVLGVYMIDGTVGFAVVSADGTVKTVLEPGMEVTTTTGRVALPDVLVIPPLGPMPIAAEIYHADNLGTPPSLSSSLARKIINRSPLHAWADCPRLNPNWEPKDSDTFDIGRAAHRLVLGVGADFEVIPADLLGANGAASTKAAKEWIADARERGITPVKEEVAEAVQRMGDKVGQRLAEMGIAFDAARSELAVAAEMDGAWCRAMIDNAPADPRLPLYDFKTTTDASPDAVIRAVETYGYDMQAAHYLDVWEAVTGERRKFRFVFVEKDPPHEVAVVQLHDDPDDDADWMSDARSKCREARRIWRECLELGHWPGYPPRVAIIGARTFHRQRWADREIGQPITKPSPAALERARAWQAPENNHAAE